MQGSDECVAETRGCVVIHRFGRFSSTLHRQEAALTCQDMIIPNWEKKTDRCALRMLTAIPLLRYSAVQKNSMYQ